VTYRWLRIRWPRRLTSERTCPRCGVGIRNWEGSDSRVWVWLYPCGHKAAPDPFTHLLHRYPPT